MLIAKKIDQKKVYILSAIGFLMIVGILYFVYKNYTLTNKESSFKEIIRLETITIKKDDTTTNNPDIVKDNPNPDNISDQPAETDFFNNDKWLSLKKTNYTFPAKTATGTDNPFGEK